MPAYLKENNIGVIKIADLVSHLRSVSGRQDQYPDSDEDQDDFFSDSWLSFDSRDSQILLESLDAVAVKGNALAHYALALIHDYGETPVGSEYWYTRAREGRTLTGVEKEWTDAHAAHLAATEKYSHHLHEAARLGNLHALFGRPCKNSGGAVGAEIPAEIDIAGSPRNWFNRG